MPKNATDIYESLRNQFLTGSTNHMGYQLFFTTEFYVDYKY